MKGFITLGFATLSILGCLLMQNAEAADEYSPMNATLDQEPAVKLRSGIEQSVFVPKQIPSSQPLSTAPKLKEGDPSFL